MRKRSGIIVKTEAEIALMEKPSRIVALALAEVKQYIKPGISTFEVDRIVEDIILRNGGYPKFKGYRDFPSAICASVNDEVVHGIPSPDKILNVGDILSVDVGVVVDGYCGDGASTFPVGEISSDAEKLLKVTESSLLLGIEQARTNNRVCDISLAVQSNVEKHGFSVVKALVGHGIGRDLHEEPQVPNFVSGPRRKSARLVSGMVLAIEPMVNAGVYDVLFEGPWATRTKDGSLSAHFEHTVAITTKGPRILTRV